MARITDSGNPMIVCPPINQSALSAQGKGSRSTHRHDIHGDDPLPVLDASSPVEIHIEHVPRVDREGEREREVQGEEELFGPRAGECGAGDYELGGGDHEEGVDELLFVSDDDTAWCEKGDVRGTRWC